MCSGNSDDGGGSSGAPFSPPPSKKARIRVGKKLQLLPRSASMSQHQVCCVAYIHLEARGEGMPCIHLSSLHQSVQLKYFRASMKNSTMKVEAV